ncbi:DUF2325 domain-containing protein [Nitrosomonas sp.]|uniref:DUF2325 domain-containing protein n=1 Tax=Nitrosomonas sp. TaxID=42353 RepID=UPI0025E94131|nr:DUF2325 domain-containing protein [Nitrosomonas sp.]MCC6917295.1 DUF2325 domain-containing protein [Nitrosomonas sp.]
MKFLPGTVLEPAYQGVQLSFKPSGIRQNKFFRSTLSRRHKQHAPEPGTRLERLCHLLHTVLLHTASVAAAWRLPAHSAHAVRRTDTNLPEIPGGTNLRWIRTGWPYRDHACPVVNRLRNSHSYLAGRLILCVGGRAALYPDYRQLIEAAGGQFMVFRGGTQGKTEYLSALLACADSVICPVDCISHEDFFTVRHYCQCIDKPCLMLQRSDLATFSKAVESLARHDSFPQKSGIFSQSGHDNPG